MSDKEKNLNETLSQIEKQFGKGTVMKMGDREIVDMPSVSTGSSGFRYSFRYRRSSKGKSGRDFWP